MPKRTTSSDATRGDEAGTGERRTKRPHGAGAIYADNRRGTLVGEIWLDGKRHRVTGPNRTSVNRRLSQLKREHARRELGDGNATVGQALDNWQRRVLEGKDLAPKTHELYVWAIDLIRSELGSTRLSNLTVDRIERALDDLASGSQGRPLSQRSLKLVRSTLGQVLDHARRRKLISDNPARDAMLPADAPRTTARKALTAEQGRALWDALAYQETYGAMFRLQLTTGLRPGEAAGLCWDALELDADPPLLHVRRAVRIEHNRIVLVDELKTASSYRSIVLPADAVEVLNRQRTQLVEGALADGRGLPRDALCFPNQAGTPIDPSKARRVLKRICADNGLPELSPNELRHSAASILIDRGVAVELVADLLGHTNFRMLAEHYRHRLRPAAGAAAALNWSSDSST
jgi:integrase